MSTHSITFRWLGQQDYLACWQAMREFTDQRTPETPDEIWLLEHSPVFTQGQNGKAEHILEPGTIPVIQTDRGGQITYHGPGQLMIYVLIDLKRQRFHVRELVTRLEQTLITFLADKGIAAEAKREAPGVYIAEKKIASIGLRIRRGCSYHGVAFNVSMDLQPFTRINPCGFAELKMTQLTALIGRATPQEAGSELTPYLIKNLGYTSANLVLRSDHGN